MIDKIIPRKLNRSKDARLLDKTEMYDAINISIDDFDTSVDSTSDTGDAGVVKPVKGNDAVQQPTGLIGTNEQFRVIGSIADEVNGEVYVFVFCTNAFKQGVYKISSSDELEEVYTSEYFQFSSNAFVKADIVYHSDNSIILYFTDGENEPRRLSLRTDIEPSENASAASKIDFITACPKTPLHPPTWQFSSDPEKPINFRSVEGFQFAYQCIYKGGEESAISTYSSVAIPPPYLSQGALSDPNLESANLLTVTIPRFVNSIENYTENIEKIRLLVRIGNDGGFFTVSEKSLEGNNLLSFDFYNDSVLTGVPQEDQDKLNDALPKVARGQTIVNDRLIYGNYTEGYKTDTVKASFSTVNTSRPEDFIDLKIGIINLMTPSFKEEEQSVSVALDGDDFNVSSTSSNVFNRRSSYQFDLSDLPAFLPENALIEISFVVTPDNNFHLYNSKNSFHAFKNNGYGLSGGFPLGESFYDDAYKYGGGSPLVFQNNVGVSADEISWKCTDELEGFLPQETGNIKFGTSPSNPFIIPKALVKFKAKFRITQDVSGKVAVKAFITNVLKRFFSDKTTTIAGVNFILSESATGSIAGQEEEMALINEGRTPTISVDQVMDSQSGYGLIPDNDARAGTVVSCFSGEEGAGPVPVGFFALNKADVQFELRYSEKINATVSNSAAHSVGPVFSLHVGSVENIETVTMIPRITRSGSRGWIYFRKEFLDNPDNIIPTRVRCLMNSGSLPPAGDLRDFDYNLFFLSNHFAPISSNIDLEAGGFLGLGTTTWDGKIVVGGLKIRPKDLLDAGNVQGVPESYDDSGLGDELAAFDGFQGVEYIDLTEYFDEGDVGGWGEYTEDQLQFLSVSNDTELDNDFRTSADTSAYPAIANWYGMSKDQYLVRMRRSIGYLNLGNYEGNIIKIQDPNSSTVNIPYSIVDGEVNIRQNYQGGRINPAFWYGLFYGTQYAGRNLNQFALSEGSDSSEPLSTGLIHGQFKYKSFDSPEEEATILDELIPEIESGRSSLSLTTGTTSSESLGRSFKRNCSHNFAILYYDERGRPGEPVPLGSHFVNQIPSPGRASIALQIDPSAPPPEWAHAYKILYGGNNSISDFVQYSSGGAFTPKTSNDGEGVIYVSLNYLQNNNEVSYSKAFGAVRYDGDKDLYTFSEGDRLRIISYYNDGTSVQYPQLSDPYEFQVIGTVTLNDDADSNPLALTGEDVHPAKTGQFVILKNNTDASGFSFQDVSNSGSTGLTTNEVYSSNNYWNRRCVFEIFTPQKKKEVESRVYYEIGDTYNVVLSSEDSSPVHQTTYILIDEGDVYFRKMAVNMADYDDQNNSFVGLIGVNTDATEESTSPNFRSYHLESKTFTDEFPNADVRPYGKPRVALQKIQPVRNGNQVESEGSSNEYTRGSSLKFSDRSNSNSNIVRYTSFNDSKLPFKDLQTNDGEIFYLINYSDSIFCIQRLKCSSIPVSRNILADALGNETVINTAQVLGSERYYAGSYGTDVPESVTHAGNAVYFVSVRNKEIYRFSPSSGIEIISEKGMGSFFDSLLSNAETHENYKVIGGFDTDQQEFILSVLAPFNSLEVSTDDPGGSNIVDSDAIDDTQIDDTETDELQDALELIVELQNQLDNVTDELEETVSNFDDLLIQTEQDAFNDGVESVDITSDNQEVYDSGYDAGFDDGETTTALDLTNAYQEGAESVDITSDNQEVYDAGFDAGVESVDVSGGGGGNGEFDWQDVRDLFESGNVSESELLEVITSFRASNPEISFDADLDLAITTTDLLYFLTSYGQQIDGIVVPPSITPED